MSAHIDNMKKALEFKTPDYLPMETCHVPGIYNAYDTLNPEDVKLIPGTENFDSIWPLGYSLKYKVIGKSDEGETIRKDQFGITYKIPNSLDSTFVLLEHPLAGKTSWEDYTLPDIEELDPWFDSLGRIIKEKYKDRFIDAFIDAGIFLTTQFLFGPNDFFMKLATDLDFVVEVYDKVADYYIRMVDKFKAIGVHQITIIEDLGSNQGLVLNPETWRKKFKPITTRAFKYIHEQGLYTGILIDGDAKQVLDDLLDMEIDQLCIPDFKVTGIEALKEKIKGKMCFKAPVSMADTLAIGTPEEVAKEARMLVEEFNLPEGGFVCEVIKWHRPAYPDKNVQASVAAFNEYRENAPVK